MSVVHRAAELPSVTASRCRETRGAEHLRCVAFTGDRVLWTENEAPHKGIHRAKSQRAAGLGLEPRLPDPESGVLPLDDPARAAIVAPFLRLPARSHGG